MRHYIIKAELLSAFQEHLPEQFILCFICYPLLLTALWICLPVVVAHKFHCTRQAHVCGLHQSTQKIDTLYRSVDAVVKMPADQFTFITVRLCFYGIIKA